MGEKTDNMTIEQSMARLEEIIAKLSDSSVTLDASLALYTEGMKLSERCLKQIDDAQLVVEQHEVREV